MTHQVPGRYRQRRQGYAAAQADAFKAGQRIEQKFFGVDEVPAAADVARSLAIPPGETVLLRRRLIRLAGGFPLQLASNYVPLRLVTDQMREEDSGPGGTYARIEDQGHTITRYEEEYLVRPATSEEREALDLDDGFPAVVDFRRIAYAGDQPLECFASVMAASRYAFKNTVSAE